MSYRYIRPERLTPNIGAMIHGVQLGEVENPEVFEEMKKALWEFQVIFLRDQTLSAEQYLRLGKAFGNVEAHEYFPTVDGHKEIQVVSTTGEKSPDTDYWHADVTFRGAPSLVHILHAQEIPPYGGDTLWASMSAAYNALPAPLKSMLLDLTATHEMAYFFRRSGYLENQKSQMDESELYRKNPPRQHPVVVEHPYSKNHLLYVNSVWTKRINEFDLQLSDDTLSMLFSWIKKPEFQVRFRWEPKSMVLWDNLATQHYATFDYAGQARRMHRMQCGSFTPTAPRRNVDPVGRAKNV